MLQPDDALHRATREVEAALRSHTAVRDVRVLARGGEAGSPQFACYVVPRDSELPPSADEGQVKKWRKVFDFMHTGSTALEADPAPPRPRWTSNYTRQPFAADEMDDWLGATVRRVKQLGPSRILEVGCGSGVLAARLAPDCVSYVGTDLSARSLEQFAAYLRAKSPGLDHVRLLEQPANNFATIPERAFDGVLLNSVIQYFPDEGYLRKVLECALRAVRPGGAIFLGDVRSLPLLRLLCTSLELFRAEPETELDLLRDRIERRIAQQDELVLSPAYFLEWCRRHAEVEAVEVEPKRGRFTNELSAFRYEVVIHVGEPHPALTPEWLDWSPELGTAGIVEELVAPGRELLGVRGIANARLAGDLSAHAALVRGSCSDVRGLGAEAAKPLVGISPEELHLLAESRGFRARLSFAGCSEEGRFDAVFERAGAPFAPIVWREPDPSPRVTFNDPIQNARRQSLIPLLLAHARKLLSPTWVPASIAVVDALPTIDAE